MLRRRGPAVHRRGFLAGLPSCCVGPPL